MKTRLPYHKIIGKFFCLKSFLHVRRQFIPTKISRWNVVSSLPTPEVKRSYTKSLTGPVKSIWRRVRYQQDSPPAARRLSR